MAVKRSVDIALLLLAIGALFAGTWYLMAIRFSEGDVYPAYSSLRTDPLGCKALHDTLEYLNPGQVRRHYSELEHVKPGPGDTLFILGLDPPQLRLIEEDMDRLASSGARIIAAIKTPGYYLLKSYEDWHEEGRIGEKRDENSREKKASREESRERMSSDKVKSNAGERKRWELDIRISGTRPDDKGRYTASLAWDSEDLPEQIPLAAPAYFNTTGSRWKTVYTISEDPVIITCNIGLGSIVLLSDAYSLSNEALRWDMHPRLISWLLAEPGKAVFVESHLGVHETKGIMTLIRKYRLTALLACFTIIALLVVWKNAVPLVSLPDPGQPGSGYIVSEKDQFTGLISLLKRNIDSKNAIRLCFDEIRKGRRGTLPRGADMDGIYTQISNFKDWDNDPVRIYNRITIKLSERIKNEHRYRQHK